MRSLTTRRIMTWIAVPLIVGQLGCAARGVRVPPGKEPRGAVTDADREACEAYAGKQKTKSVVGLRIFGALFIPISVGLAGASLLMMRPDGLRVLAGGPVILGEASKNAQANQVTREAALRECLEPLQVEQAEGPAHPRLAQSLATLARGYVAFGDLTHAEPLYQRALAIQEQALGSGHSDAIATRHGYAALLRKAHREAEAAALEARDQASDPQAARSHETEATIGGGASLGAADPATPGAGRPETPAQAEE